MELNHTSRESAMNRRTVIALIVIAVLMIFSLVFPQSVYSQDTPVVVERPMVNGKQQLMELRIRRSDHCVIYRIEIDNITYIANTCGGIVVEPKNGD